MRSTFNLPPVSSSLAATSLLGDPRRSPRYPGYEARSAPNEHSSDLPARPSDHSGSTITRPVGSLYIPSHIPQQRYVSPNPSSSIYHTPRPHEFTSSFLLPAPPQDLPWGSWQEGEAGPSSLVHTPHRDQGRGENRRGSSQPAQFKPKAETHRREGGSESGGYSLGARELGMEGFYGGIGSSHPRMPYTWSHI